MVESTLGELLVRAEGATSLHSNKDGIPPVKQGLAALQQRTADLAFTGHTVQGTEQAISKARQFLPSGHTDDFSRLVTSLERKPGFQPTPQVAVPGPDVELEAYLDKHYINMIWTAIDESAEAAEMAAHRAEIQWEEEDWREARLDFRKAKQVSAGTMLLEQTLALTSQFDQPQAMDYDHAGGDGMEVAVNPSLVLGMMPRAKSRLSNVQLEYAKRVAEATSGSSQGDGLANLLYSAADQLAKDSQGVSADAEEYRRTLRLLRSMLEEEDGTGLYKPVLQGEQGPEAWSPVLAARARRHLEEEIYEVIRNRTLKILAEARSRTPTDAPQGLLEAYVDYKTTKSTAASQGRGAEPNPYEVLYWLLRTGHLSHAIDYVSNAPPHRFAAEIRYALITINAATNHQAQASEVSQAVGAVKDLLAQRSESEDVFEKAVLNLLAFDNPNKVDKQRVVQITEDYLWHCLWFTQPCNPANQDLNPSQGRFDIYDLAKKILRWGEQYFDPDGGRSFLYARILFVSQLFREGVAHLYKNKHVEAVHAALLLDHYGLFRDLSRSEVGRGAGAYVMTVEDMVLGYVKDFQDSDGERAADYLMLLKPWSRMKRLVEALLEATEDQTALARLAAHLKAKRFEMVSYVRPPARPGQASQPATRLVESWDAGKALEVIRAAAVTTERSLSSSKALALYKLAEDDTSALRVLNKQLCQVVVTPNSSREAWWKEVAYFTDDKLEGVRDANVRATLVALQHLYHLFDVLDAGNVGEARKILEGDLKVVFPLTPDPREVEQAVASFTSSSTEFKRVLGEAAARAMRVWMELYRQSKRAATEPRLASLSRDGYAYQQAGVAGVEAQAREVQVRAKALLKWCLDLRVSRDLPSEVISRIQRMEAMCM